MNPPHSTKANRAWRVRALLRIKKLPQRFVAYLDLVKAEENHLFFNAALQLDTTVIGRAVSLSTKLQIRNFWPLFATT